MKALETTPKGTMVIVVYRWLIDVHDAFEVKSKNHDYISVFVDCRSFALNTVKFSIKQLIPTVLIPFVTLAYA